MRRFSTVFERSSEMFCRTLKGILSRICSVAISPHRCLKGVFHRIATIFYLSKLRKTAGSLLPLENPTPKESDHPPSKQALFNSSSEADSQCQNIHVFFDQSLEQNHDYSSESTKDSATIFIPSFSSHVLDSYSTRSIAETEYSAVITEEYAPRKNVSYADQHEQPGILISVEKNICEESSEEKESAGEKVILESTVVVEKARWIKHYSSSHRILLVGEGDFSFSCSLSVAFGCATRMIATSLDSRAFLKENYDKAPWNIGELKKRDCIVMHGIDATTIATHPLLQHMTFDRIIYNFPFAGFFKGLSRNSSLRRHRRLVSLFLKNAKEMIDEDGEIHISHKTNGYHREWNLVSMASSHGLRLMEEDKFDLRDYPGYNTKRGFGGDENFNCYPSSTFKFGFKFVRPGSAW